MKFRSVYSAILLIVVTAIILPMQLNAENDTNPPNSLVDLENFTPPIIDSTSQTAETKSSQDSEALVEQRMNFAKEMSLYILAFGLILAIFTGIIALSTKGWNREATNVFTVTIIITAGLFLMTAGYSSEQIAPMYGLLGTVVGYLLGKSRSPGDESK